MLSCSFFSVREWVFFVCVFACVWCAFGPVCVLIFMYVCMCVFTCRSVEEFVEWLHFLVLALMSKRKDIFAHI